MSPSPFSLLHARIKLGLTRIISSRPAFLFFLISFLSAIIQIAILASSFTNDFDVMTSITENMNPNSTVFAMFRDGGVELCTNITVPERPTPCDLIPVGQQVGGTVLGRDGQGEVELSVSCQQALNYPLQILALFKREDITNIAMNVWMLFIANYAVMAESAPHVLTFFAGKSLQTLWSCWTLYHSPTIVKPQFDQLLYEAPCFLGKVGNGVLDEGYWKMRLVIQATSAGVNAIGLLLTLWLTYVLISKYNAQTYARVSASPCLVTMYRFALTLNASTQLGLFFFLASGGLWLDRLLAGGVLKWALYPTIYVGLFVMTVALVPIWSAFGWYGIRRENKIFTSLYLFIALFFVGSWSAMFKSIIYRYFFYTWSFWSFVTVLGMTLLCVILILTGICWYNFGKGIKHWLYVRKQLSSSNFAAGSFEDGLGPDPDSFSISTVPPSKEELMDPDFQFVFESNETKRISFNPRNGEKAGSGSDSEGSGVASEEVDLKTPPLIYGSREKLSSRTTTRGYS